VKKIIVSVTYQEKMSRLFLLLFTVLLLTSGCKMQNPLADRKVVIEKPPEAVLPEANYSDQSTWLLGYFTREQMYRTPHCTWYLEGYDKYFPDSVVMMRLAAIPVGDITIKIVMGTWCPDSRREVPRFQHILDLWQFPDSKVTFIGVDNSKLSPVGEYDQLNIQRVPTFIFFENNIEAGRIIENPVTSLEQDILNILTGNEKQ
jgi:thiol-disulfide isomerase/thioredoxin